MVFPVRVSAPGSSTRAGLVFVPGSDYVEKRAYAMPDVVVIGGGIAGVSVGYELARLGAGRVVLWRPSGRWRCIPPAGRRRLPAQLWAARWCAR